MCRWERKKQRRSKTKETSYSIYPMGKEENGRFQEREQLIDLS